MSNTIDLSDSPDVRIVDDAARRPEVIDLLNDSDDGDVDDGLFARRAMRRRDKTRPTAAALRSPSNTQNDSAKISAFDAPASSERRVRFGAEAALPPDSRLKSNSGLLVASAEKKRHRMQVKDPPGANTRSTRRPRLKEPPNGAVAVAPAAVAAVATRPAVGPVYTVENEDDASSSGAARLAETRVLEVFPDVELGHVAKLLEQYGGHAERVLAHLVENAHYPRSKISEAQARVWSVPIHRDQVTRKWTHDFSSSSSFVPSPVYTVEAGLKLYHTFLWISKKGSQTLIQKYSHYAIAHEKIVAILKGSSSSCRDDAGLVEQLNRYEAALHARKLDAALHSQLQQLVPTGSAPVVLGAARGATPFEVTDAILREEVEYVDLKMQDWMNAASLKRERAIKKAKVQEAGTGVECSCCCDEYDIDDMVSCLREGHLFCVDCMQKHAATKLFGEGNLGINKTSKKLALELTCFHSDGCDSPFERTILVKALAPATLQKYDEIQAQLTISMAGLNDLVTCPKCNYQASLASSERVFVCPCDDCGFASCRECGEAAHVPLRCNELEKDVETKGRLTVEEAISAAKIRHCPKCKKGFVKSDGCNKIRCGCGILVCYICQQQIAGYEHFCQTPHCTHTSCKKCRLWSNTEEDDATAMKEAGLQAASQVKTQLIEGSRGELNIDVDSILRDPGATARRQVPARMHQRQMPAGMPQRQVPAGMPQRQVPAGMPQRQVPAGMPQRQAPAGMPQRQVPAGVPQRQVPAGMPQRQVPAGMPQRQVPAGTPQRQVPAGTPQRQVPAGTPHRRAPAGMPQPPQVVDPPQVVVRHVPPPPLPPPIVLPGVNAHNQFHIALAEAHGHMLRQLEYLEQQLNNVQGRR